MLAVLLSPPESLSTKLGGTHDVLDFSLPNFSHRTTFKDQSLCPFLEPSFSLA